MKPIANASQLATIHRILVVRPDRLGDVILSTPVFEAVKTHFPKAKLTVMVQPSIVPLIQGLPSVDEVWSYPVAFGKSLKSWLEMVSKLRSGKFDLVVVLQTHWRLAMALRLAGIPLRVGPLSKVHSYLLYNHGVRQGRSQVKMHEADYNLGLLEGLGITIRSRTIPTRVNLSPSVLQTCRQWLIQQGYSEEQPWVAVHPGMGGSALNWPLRHYIDLIQRLLNAGKRVLVTTGPTELELSREIERALKDTQPIFYRAPSDGSHTLEHLAGFYGLMKVVVAPSTGPLHVAVAVGKPVVTFYPPIRVQSKERWGPYEPTSKHPKSVVFTPFALASGPPKDLEGVSVEEVFREVNRVAQEEIRQ